MTGTADSNGIGSRIGAFLDELRAIQAERRHEIHKDYNPDETSKTKTNMAPIKFKAPSVPTGQVSAMTTPVKTPKLPALKVPTPKSPTAPSVSAPKGPVSVG